MMTMAQQFNPDDLRMAMPPEGMAPVDPHAALTAPIMAAPQPSPMMAAPAGSSLTAGAPAKMSALAPVEKNINSRLMADYQKDANPYGSPDNHPGFFGKLLHGLNVVTGGVNRRGMEEQGLEKRLQDVSKLESEEGLQGAQTGATGANQAKTEAETAGMPQEQKDKSALSGATAANLESETRDRDLMASYGPSIVIGHARAVNQAIAAGRDPATDPIVQQYEDAMQRIQKPPADSTGPKTITKQIDGKEHTFSYDPSTKGYTHDEGLTGTKPPVVRVETPGESRGAKNDLLKAYQPTLDSAERMNVMTESYEKAIKNHDQQAMLNLLANHLGMTMGLQKGSRLTRDIIHEAQQSQPWLQGIASKFDKDGYLAGVTLSPGQMRQMVELGQERYSEDAKKSRATAQYLGGKDDGPERVPGKATINYYLGKTGGDVAKARQMATQDGWTVK